MTEPNRLAERSIEPEGAGRHARVRVATVPSDHVYVRHIDFDAEDDSALRVVRLQDPDPDNPTRSAVSRWWPPVMLEDGWVDEHRNDFDIFHIQFGFDARTPDQLEELVEALRRSDRPLVYTVHDLRNPHHASRAEHDAQLNVLVPAADALITLTQGAASEISRRWNREALVLPHPHVVDFDRMKTGRRPPTRRARAREFRVGVHVKSLRASMDPQPVIEVLTRAVREIPGGVLQVNGHRDVLDPDGARYNQSLAKFLRTAESNGLLELHVHDFLDDASLWNYLQSLDVSVLPYRFGTHSGWLEACRDLGVTVIAPDCGYFADQGPVISYSHSEAGLDRTSLVRAVKSAYVEGAGTPPSVAYRVAQRRAVAQAHIRLYRTLLE